MATEAEVKQREERRELLDEIKRRRAAAAQAEGSLGAAERGDYGEVGQGEKGPFDDEINQAPNNSLENLIILLIPISCATLTVIKFLHFSTPVLKVDGP